MTISYNEFHVSRTIRDLCGFSGTIYASSGNVLFSNMHQVRLFAGKLNSFFEHRGESSKSISAGSLNAMGLIDEILHYVCMAYRQDICPAAVSGALTVLDEAYGYKKVDELLLAFDTEFPPSAVYQGMLTPQQYLAQNGIEQGTGVMRSNRESTLEEMILLHLANENPAFKPFSILFDDIRLQHTPLYQESWELIQSYFKTQPLFGPFNHALITLLREPVVFSPNSLKGQLDYIHTHWKMIPAEWLKKLLTGMDTIAEEEKAAWQPVSGSGPDMAPYSYENLQKEYERFSPDRDWMPKVVLLAKSVLVWLDQLSKKYGKAITQLDQIPDEELNILADEGFTGLWLIGLWERSSASRRIKQLCGNPEAAASAYSLYDYDIASNLGGWTALDNLRKRLWQRGIRLASDMVPNHTGIDSRWIMEKPQLFIQRRDCPFPQYSFKGENLSHDNRTSIYLEDHYYNKTDCAVVFKRVDNATGDTRYIYHGNDGTGMPWNDTAQIDFLNPAAREEVIQEILTVARNFPIIRFDAAMVLAKKHIRRLWYPEPGHGGDIATRSETGLSTEQFEKAIPEEFWREVVDRVAKEVPDTLLLAEAFWMMEGYFVRTLGMHRVYNSAFMNMLKKEENKKYRDTVRNTLAFDPQVLKRFVNFMNNPDEETAVAQFGKGDKYFGVCTLMVTMPGLPMFGHGQIEGFEEKYGMEYTKAYRNETPDAELLKRHQRDIFPLMKKRYLFAQIENFLFYDIWNGTTVEENIFAYSNSCGSEYAAVFYNNAYQRASGWIRQSVPYAVRTGPGEKDMEMRTRTIAQGLGLKDDPAAFCIFREQRSGLFFIRSCTDICRNGLFVSLNGFECQVLMDFRHEEDTSDGKYSTLCTSLGGKGCEDLDIEWSEIRYKKIYAALDLFLSAPFITSIHTLLTVKRSDSAVQLKKLLKETEKSALAFYKTAGKAAGLKKDISRSCFLKFSRIVKLLIQNNSKKTVVYKTAAEKQAAAFLHKAAAADPAVPDMLFCYAAVSAFADKGYAAEWMLYRKCAGYLNKAGISCPAAADILKRLFKLSGTRTKTAFDIVHLLVESTDSPFLCGVNTYAGISWFNKERTESSLRYITVQKLITAPAKQKTEVLKQYRKITAAQKKAEYKCSLFIKPFIKKKGQ